MDALTRHCPRLAEFHAGACTKLSDASMRYIATGWRTLRVLDVSGCSKITDTGIHVIIQQCRELGEFVKPN